MKYSLPLVLATSTIIPIVSAQETLPEDLRATIEEDSTEIQVSYSGDASDGFDDATVFSPDDTQTPPEFALGEFSGIGTRNNFLLAMIDTTCSDKRTLHLLQPELRNTGVKTQLGSEVDPLVEYIPPGTSGEQGTRQYSFVIWRTKKDVEFVSVPAGGEDFDVASFQEENDLKDPEAGIAMIVELGGEAECEVRDIESVPIPEDSTPVEVDSESESEEEEDSDDDDDDDSLPNNDFVNDGDGKDDNDLSDDAPNSNGEFSNNSDNNDGNGSLLDNNDDDDDDDAESEDEEDTEVNDSIAGSGGSDDVNVTDDNDTEDSSNDSSEGSSNGGSLPNNDFDNNGDGQDDNDLSDDAPNSNGEFSNNSESNDNSNSSTESIGSTEGDASDDDSADANVLDTPSVEVDDAAPSLLKSRAVLAAAGLGLVAALFA